MPHLHKVKVFMRVLGGEGGGGEGRDVVGGEGGGGKRDVVGGEGERCSRWGGGEM